MSHPVFFKALPAWTRDWDTSRSNVQWVRTSQWARKEISDFFLRPRWGPHPNMTILSASGQYCVNFDDDDDDLYADRYVECMVTAMQRRNLVALTLSGWRNFFEDRGSAGYSEPKSWIPWFGFRMKRSSMTWPCRTAGPLKVSCRAIPRVCIFHSCLNTGHAAESCRSDPRTCAGPTNDFALFHMISPISDFTIGFCNFTTFTNVSRKVGKETTAFEPWKENSLKGKVSCRVWTPISSCGIKCSKICFNLNKKTKLILLKRKTCCEQTRKNPLDSGQVFWTRKYTRF